MRLRKFVKISLCNILYLLGIDRYLRHQYRKRLLVVAYHGVTRSNNPSQTWTLLPAPIFEQQISWLAKHYHPVTLQTVLLALQKGRPLPNNSVLITLDDGFRNNMTVAYPILKKYQVPAVIFLTVDYINTDRFFWVDELWMTIQEAGKQQTELQLTNPQANIFFAQKKYSEAYCVEVEFLKRKPRNERLDALVHLLSQLTYDKSSYKEDFGMLTWPEVLRMEAEGFMEFGSHTATHCILSNTADELLEEELAGSKRKLEERLNHEGSAFCYPNGHFGIDYLPDHRRVLAHYGYQCAFSTDYGLYNPDKDHPFSIPRVEVGNDISLYISFSRLNMSGLFEYRRSFY